MIRIELIEDLSLKARIDELDEQLRYLKHEFGIVIKSYGNILRVALNAIQPELLDNLLERVKINRELDRALDSAGGYSIDFLGNKNPKVSLIGILAHLKEHQMKLNRLVYLTKSNLRLRKTYVCENHDFDFLKKQIRDQSSILIPYSTFRKLRDSDATFFIYSFNGARDFELLYNHSSNIVLVLYEQEYFLYEKQIQKRKHLIEDEIKSEDRLRISGIQYVPAANVQINISQTIEDIVKRLDELNTGAYNCYKDECDILLDEIDDKKIYKLTLSDETTLYLDSNDTVFKETGELIRAYKLNKGERIRVYPKDEFAEKLYQVAVETEPDLFGAVEEHSKYWQNIIGQLQSFHRHNLYLKLKERGMKVLESTMDAYLRGQRKFPMFNNDLRSIIQLFFIERSPSEIDQILLPILKSKAAYNSTMIALGRGLKQELKLFFKEGRIGEILLKRNFNSETLNRFINEHMPLLTILEKEEYENETEVMNLIQKFDV